MTIHTDKGTICNGYYAPNMRAHMDSFTIITPAPCSSYKSQNYHGTPMMTKKPFEPVKMEPIKFETKVFEPIKFESKSFEFNSNSFKL